MNTDHTAPPVLLVEDDEPTQTLMRAILRRAGYAAEVASNGREAIDLLRTRRYAAVVLDMMMPEVSGREVVEFLKTTSNPVPVIVCSAAGPTTWTALDPNVVKAIVRKPFDVEHFIDAVAAATEAAAQPARVLIVDDDHRARYILRAFLEPAEVIEAESGDDAFEMLRHVVPDVVLLDLILPGTPGDDVLRQLAERDDTRALPVVIVTSRALDEEQRTKLLRHAAAVVYKGELSRETLRAALQAARTRRS